MCEVFVAEPWTIDIDAKGVRITYRSDNDVFVRRMSRADYRKGVELSLRQLNDYERTERCEIMAFKRQRGRHN